MPDDTNCIFIRGNQLDATIHCRGQNRRGTRNVSTFDVYQDDVDTQWQKVLVEKGENLTEYEKPTAAECKRQLMQVRLLGLVTNVLFLILWFLSE